MPENQIGIIGLGVMGQNLVLNIADKGYRVSVYNRTTERTHEFMRGEASKKAITATFTLEEFVASLECPRKIQLMVQAGSPVDRVIAQLIPLLDKEDIIIDGGNSFFQDTERRAKELEAEDLYYFGMGVSGGEEGARWGPSLMPGGSRDAYPYIEALVRDIAAKAPHDGVPCVTYIGPRGAGHYVKMVHNGIEYADMQLIAEVYDLLNTALNLTANDLHEIFSSWNKGELSSFLIEITANIFTKIDEETNQPLVEVILDRARQKGTGKWTSQTALDLQSPIPSITAAVEGRNISLLKEEREVASQRLMGTDTRFDGDHDTFVNAVRAALYSSKVCAYAQGMALLRTASEEYGYSLDLAAIAQIWRAGCIIRAQLLEDIAQAYQQNPRLQNLLIADNFRIELLERQDQWRYVIKTAIDLGVPIPVMSASLAYFDAYRSKRLPTNLIQAQRDYFGAHTFERIDKEGSFHADWYSQD